ncbi:MAG: hypothetical protein M0T74_14665, partial [Desulfitobacterium hafniense]|nr:hypothetical protein [Desulfitobacterium hafniense]
MSTSRERVALAIRHCITDRIPKGELCIDDAVILRDLQCERVSFPERYEFVKRLGLDLVCLAPEYQHENGLPESDTCIPPDLDRWTMETQLFSFALLDGVFGWGMRTLGYEEFFKLPMRSPQVFTSLLKEVEKLNI